MLQQGMNQGGLCLGTFPCQAGQIIPQVAFYRNRNVVHTYCVLGFLLYTLMKCYFKYLMFSLHSGGCSLTGKAAIDTWTY